MGIQENPPSPPAPGETAATSVSFSPNAAAAAPAPAPEPPSGKKSGGGLRIGENTLPGIEKLGAGIRELVEAELKAAGVAVRKLETDEPAQKPQKGDVLFLVLAVVNLVLLVWMIPSEILKDDRIAFLKDLIPYALGSLFVLLTAWYHDSILPVSRKKGLRIFNIGLLSLLLVFWAPWVSLPPIDPSDAHVTIDEKRTVDAKDTPRVSLWQTHTYQLEKEYDVPPPRTRQFKRSGWELWREKSHGNQLHWSLLYPLRITSRRTDVKVRIERDGSVFDKDFLKSLDQYHLVKSPNPSEQDHIVVFVMPSGQKTATPQLPIGTYHLRSETDGCAAPADPLLMVSQQNAVTVTLKCE